jgi:hypothetical protein
MNRNLIFLVLIILGATFISGCIDSVPAQPQPQTQQETPKLTVHEINTDTILGSQYPNYHVIHDDKINQTCTVYSNGAGSGISCIADSQLK